MNPTQHAPAGPADPGPEYASVTVTVIGVEQVAGMGAVTALGTVEVEWGGIAATIQGVRVMRGPGGLRVEAPRFRHPRTGQWLPAMLLPKPVTDAIAAELLAGKQRAA